MDEPFGALDAITRDLLHDELEALWLERRFTVLFVTHNVREAARLGDRIVLLTSRPGRVAATFEVDLARPRRIDSPEIADAGGHGHRPAAGGGGPPWPLTARRRSRIGPTLDQAWPDSTPSTRPGGPPATGCLDGCGGRPGPSWWPSGLILLVWQIAVWAHWKPYILQSPATVARQLWELLGTSLFWQACWVTAQQAIIGYVLVLLIGGIVGTAVARMPVLRAGIGSLITGMQTMPSVLWYPLGIMVFGVTAKAIILMMILGAAPAVANGFISGIDQVPPGLLRVGRILGARGLSLERHVVLPAAFPSILGGMKQGWAFAWHALDGRGVPHPGQSAQPRRAHGQRGHPGRVGGGGRHDDRHRLHRHHGGRGVLARRPVRAPAIRADRCSGRLMVMHMEPSSGPVVPTLRRHRSSVGNAVLSISARVDYAVQVLCALAESNRIMTARQLSVSLGLPHKFLEAILTDLHRGVILTSRRGLGGGFGLARPADEMSLDEVITSLVGAVAEVRGQIPEAIDYRGPAENLRTAWLAVRSNLRLTLEEITIADIVAGDLSRIADPSAIAAPSEH